MNKISGRFLGKLLALILLFPFENTSAQYCLPPADQGTTLGSYINSVELPGLLNQSGPSISPYYLYFSNLDPAILEAGVDYNLSIVAGSMTNDYFSVWVDWNNDLDFTDDGELIGEQMNTLAGETLFFTLNVPVSTATSYKRMRIRCGPNINLDPCLNYGYGETEDYTLLIQPPPLNYCIPSSFAGSESGNFIQAIRLNDLVNSTGASTSPHYFVADTLLKPRLTKGSAHILNVMGGTSTINRYGAWIDWNNDGDYIDVGENIGDEPNSQAYQQHGFYFSVPADAQSGMLRMRVRCSEVFSGTLNPCANYANGETEDYVVEVIDSLSGYCTPQFSEGTSNNTFLNRITLDNLFYDLLAAPNFYANYSNSFYSAPLKANRNYMLYLGAQGDAFATTRYAAWIDYNRDGDFSDAQEYLGETRMNSVFASSFISFQTPGIYDAGRTRLRILVAPEGVAPLQSCGSYTLGECKDFAIELQQFSAGLCVPAGNTDQGDFINTLTFGDIQSEEGAQGATPYRYYGSSVCLAAPGEQIQLQLQGGSNALLPVCYGAWVDWNNDLVYSDSERFGLETLSGSAFPNVQFTMDVPPNQAEGFVHLRIRAMRNSSMDSTLFTACSDHAFGETEDYRIYISPSSTSICGNLHSNGSFNGVTIDDVRLLNSDLHKNAEGFEGISGNAYTLWPIENQLSTSLVQPQAYYLKVNTSGDARIGAWLDLNQNQSFEATEFYPIYTSPTTNQFFFLISIPPNTPAGYVTLRIRARSGGPEIGADEACSLFTTGETEDFRLYITTSRGLPPVADFDYSLIATEANYTSTSGNFPDFWTWFFEGGNSPSTIGDNATVYYGNNQPGCLSSSITASNFYGSDTYVNPCAVYIPETNTCNSLMFSEYLCDASNNRALELVNASSQQIDLSEHTIALYSNGNFIPTQTLHLSGNLDPYQTLVIANPAADSAIQALAAFSSGVCSFTGNDVLALLKNGSITDAIGKLGEAPLNGWTIGAAITQNICMRRDITVSQPNANWDASQSGWIAYSSETLDDLGNHEFNCGTYIGSNVLNANFSQSANLICVGDFISLSDQSEGNPTNWIWTLPGSLNETESGANPGAIYYITPGTYAIGLAISNALGFDAALLEQAVTVLDYPNPQIVIQGNELICLGCAANTSWSLNGSELPGATGQNLSILAPGEYTVTTSNESGCIATSPIFAVFTVNGGTLDALYFSVYPNPTSGILRVDVPANCKAQCMYDVTDVLGRVMRRGLLKDALSIEELPSGNYFLRIWKAGQALSVKHIVKR